MHPVIYVIIPAFNEAGSIAKVIREVPAGLVHGVIVVNNASNDNTGDVAGKAGAIVLYEAELGYGRACLRGIEYCKIADPGPDIVVFLDGDYSDYPEEMIHLVEPIIANNADLVIGSRKKALKEKGSMTLPQIFGNWLATTLLRALYKVRFTDLGPFRAIRFSALLGLDMRDTTYGWTVEMQLKAAKAKLRCQEVSVRYRKRIGKSKISGTIKGTVMAGYKILFTIFRYL